MWRVGSLRGWWAYLRGYVMAERYWMQRSRLTAWRNGLVHVGRSFVWQLIFDRRAP